MTLLTGCNITYGKTLEKEDPSLQGTITLWTGQEYLSFLEDAASKFKLKNPKVVINIVPMEKGPLGEGLEASYNNGEVKPDIAILDSRDIQQNASKEGLLLPLTELLSKETNNFTKGRLDEVKVKEEYFGFPFTSNPYVLVFREDLLNSYGINYEDLNTWNNLIKAFSSLERSEENLNALALAEENLSEILALLINEIYMETFNKDKILESTLYKYGQVFDVIEKLKSEGIIDLFINEEEVIKALEEGRATLAFANIKTINSLKSKGDSYGVRTLPAFEPGGNSGANLPGANAVVFQGTENKELVEEFILQTFTNEKLITEAMEDYDIFPAFQKVFSSRAIDEFQGFKANRPYNLLEESLEDSNPIT